MINVSQGKCTKKGIFRSNSFICLFSDDNCITLTIHMTSTFCSTAPFSPGSVWAWRPASAARCSPPPARYSPVAGEPQVTCTPWCHHAADSSGAPPSGFSVGPEQVNRGRRGRDVSDQNFNLVWPNAGKRAIDWTLLLQCNCLCHVGSFTLNLAR